MVYSEAKTVKQYLAELPDDRREVIEAVRAVILKHLPNGYEETMLWGMITYAIPLERYPDTYNGQPLGIAALAAQKNNYAIYLMGVYGSDMTREWFEREWKNTGKKLQMGKSCVRFKKLDDIPLDLIGQLIAKIPVETYIKHYEQSLDARGKRTKQGGLQ